MYIFFDINAAYSLEICIIYYQFGIAKYLFHIQTYTHNINNPHTNTKYNKRLTEIMSS